MTPKNDVVMLDINNTLKDNILKIKETKFSRFPVYDNNKNNIIGVLNVKDFIIHHREDKNLQIKDIIRPIHQFNFKEKIDDVFRYMQEKNESIGAVYKDNKFVGIVTVEDAVEEIMGNIYDEYEIDKKEI